MSTKKKIKVNCNYCSTLTNHEIIADYTVYETEEFEGGNQDVGKISYQIVSCMGCESVSYRTEDTYRNYIEFFNEKTGEFKIVPFKSFEKFFPERMGEMLNTRNFSGLTNSLKQIYRETIDCYNSNHQILCAVGLRAVVEGVCNHTNTKGENLSARIKGMSKRGLISRKLSEALDVHRFLGNQAVHNLSVADKEELLHAIKLIDQLLEAVFETPHHHSILKGKVTNRVINE
jgi:hypothetical protein